MMLNLRYLEATCRKSAPDPYPGESGGVVLGDDFSEGLPVTLGQISGATRFRRIVVGYLGLHCG